MNKNIAFIGAGKMATALISCIYKNNISKSIIANKTNKNPTKTLTKVINIVNQ